MDLPYHDGANDTREELSGVVGISALSHPSLPFTLPEPSLPPSCGLRMAWHLPCCTHTRKSGGEALIVAGLSV